MSSASPRNTIVEVEFFDVGESDCEEDEDVDLEIWAKSRPWCGQTVLVYDEQSYSVRKGKVKEAVLPCLILNRLLLR